MIITSVKNKLVLDLLKLKDTKNIKARKEFLVEGEHLVNEAYSNGLLKLVLSTIDREFKDVEVIIVTEEIIKKLSNTVTPQSIIGVCKLMEEKQISGNVIILDSIKDPGNLGTIIRTALAFEVTSIIASKDTVSIYNDKVIRATQGAIFKINICYTDLVTKLGELKQNGYNILSTSLKANKYISQLGSVSPFALIIGNEANGVSNEVESLATEVFKIKISDKMESLNAAVASAICLYELTK